MDKAIYQALLGTITIILGEKIYYMYNVDDEDEIMGTQVYLSSHKRQVSRKFERKPNYTTE